MLRASEDKYRRLFDDNITGDFIANSDGSIIECNPAFAEIYGFADREQAARWSLSSFNPNDWDSLISRLKKDLKVQNFESVHRRHDGNEICIIANVIGLFNDAGELTGVKGYIFDNTERKRAEKLLRDAEDRLETRVKEKTAELEQANKALREEVLERRRTEIELNIYCKHLEDLVKERASELEVANVHL